MSGGLAMLAGPWAPGESRPGLVWLPVPGVEGEDYPRPPGVFPSSSRVSSSPAAHPTRTQTSSSKQEATKPQSTSFQITYGFFDPIK